MKHFSHIITYILLTVNTLLTILYCFAYCLYEVDLFLVVWISCVLAIFSFPIGLGLSIYAIVQKNSPIFRKVALIWNAVLIAMFVLLFFILPNGTNRIPNGMEKKYIANRDAIIHLCRYATDSLSLPDSTALVITENDSIRTRRVMEKYIDVLINPGWIFTKDTVFDIDASQAQRILQLHKAANVGEFTVFSPDSLVHIHFTSRGLGGSYWYEIPRHPYTEEDMYLQLNNIHTCPYSPEVSFHFDGGAIGHEDPYPKTDFLHSHNIDSAYIYNLFH